MVKFPAKVKELIPSERPILIKLNPLEKVSKSSALISKVEEFSDPAKVIACVFSLGCKLRVPKP